MAKCAYCGSFIIGGVRAGVDRFCNRTCLSNAQVLSLAQQIPPQVVDQQVEQVFRGNCPKCGGLGPIDVHKVHSVWSALVLTRWSTRAKVSCRSCATKTQLGGVLSSAALGWWGFPWGLVLTPIQITRNVIEICSRSGEGQPSAALRRLVLAQLGAQAARPKRQTPPPIPA